MSAGHAARARALTLFDLDETLLPFDSDHAWGEFMIRLGWVDEAGFRRENDAFYEQYKAGRLDVVAYIEFTTRPLRQRPPAERDAAHRRYMDEVVRPQMHPAAVDLVRRHAEAGDLVAMVTATNEFVTAPIAAAFGIAHLLAIRLERGPGDTITGRIDGVPTYREGKVLRCGEWLESLGRHWTSFDRVTVYSDSANDLPLLERATEPVATNPSAALESIARERGWRVLHLFS